MEQKTERNLYIIGSIISDMKFTRSASIKYISNLDFTNIPYYHNMHEKVSYVWLKRLKAYKRGLITNPVGFKHPKVSDTFVKYCDTGT